MSQAPSKERATPLSVRFTVAEKARLKQLAGSMPIGQYIRAQSLQGNTVPRAARRSPVKDAEPLGQLLGLLGQSRLASNLNQLAKAAHQGSLPVTQEVEDDLRRACAEVFEMRVLLLQALGLQIMEDSKAPGLVAEFAQAAGGPAG
jgi:hypothetical protein